MNTVYDLLKQLQILGSICQNDKLCTQKGSIDVYRPSSYRGVQRWWSGENRLVNLQQVRFIVDRSCDTATMLLERLSSSTTTTPVDGALMFMDRAGLVQITRSLLSALDKAADGLQNLVKTYEDDYATSADIRLMVTQARQFIQRAGEFEHSPRLHPTTTPSAEASGLSALPSLNDPILDADADHSDLEPPESHSGATTESERHLSPRGAPYAKTP